MFVALNNNNNMKYIVGFLVAIATTFVLYLAQHSGLTFLTDYFIGYFSCSMFHLVKESF